MGSHAQCVGNEAAFRWRAFQRNGKKLRQKKSGKWKGR